MEYDIILVTGEVFFDHPLCGAAIIKRLLEKQGYCVGLIEMPKDEDDIARLGKPKLFFGVSSGSVDSMVRNYTPLKNSRVDDPHKKRDIPHPPDRAVIVYSNWIKKRFKDSIIVLGGTEASLRRFAHYDYWQNRVRRPILFDTRADILVYGNGEKPILEISERISAGKDIAGIEGTCIISHEMPDSSEEIPSDEEVTTSKDKFSIMQMMLSNERNLAQRSGNRYCLQYRSPSYTSKDLDSYYGLPFSRSAPPELRGFEFSVVTHRGCIGNCSFCALALLQGDKIVSRSEDSIIEEIEGIARLPHFKGNIDDLGGPSANMYGMDCKRCSGECIRCNKLDRSNSRMIALLKRARAVPGVKNVFIKSGIRFDLANEAYIKEVSMHHIFDKLRVSPEHVNKDVLRLMNKDHGDIEEFRRMFHKHCRGKELSYYFMTAHPGSTMKEANELKVEIAKLKNAESVQIFTPTPMTISTCMYYTGKNPRTGKEVYVPYTYNEKKQQRFR